MWAVRDDFAVLILTDPVFKFGEVTYHVAKKLVASEPAGKSEPAPIRAFSHEFHNALEVRDEGEGVAFAEILLQAKADCTVVGRRRDAIRWTRRRTDRCLQQFTSDDRQERTRLHRVDDACGEGRRGAGA